MNASGQEKGEGRMIVTMMAIMLAGGQAAAAPPAPSAEAETLGVTLARGGMLAILLPQLAAKDVEDLIAHHPDLSAADRDQLRAAARRILEARSAQLMTLIGHQYALSLSLDDLKTLTAFNASPAAQHWRAAEPGAIMAAAKALDGYDFKGQLAAEFCKESGKLCEGEPGKK